MLNYIGSAHAELSLSHCCLWVLFEHWCCQKSDISDHFRVGLLILRLIASLEYYALNRVPSLLKPFFLLYSCFGYAAATV